MKFFNIFFSFSFATSVFLGMPTVNAYSLFDYYGEVSSKNSAEEVSQESVVLVRNYQQAVKDESFPQEREEISEKASQFKLTEEHCHAFNFDYDLHKHCLSQYWNQVSLQQEKEEILARRENFELTYEYCVSRKSFDNHYVCLGLFYEQQEDCTESEVSGNKLIIDLQNQRMYGFKKCQLVLNTNVITGADKTPTITGKFKIYHSKTKHWMQGQWYVETAYFFKGGYAIHDAKWRQEENWKPERRGIHGSHGCINTPDEAMEVVWNEFGYGDAVEVYRHLPQNLKQEIAKRTDNENTALAVKKSLKNPSLIKEDEGV